MPSWQGKSRGTPLGYRIFVGILKRFGVKPAYLLLRFVALYYFLFSYKSSRPVYRYFRERLKYSRMGSLKMLYKNYYRFGQSIIDKVVIMSGMENPFTYQFDGEENLHNMAAEGKGGLLISAHLGNWEIAGHLLKRIGTAINIVMYDGEHQQIKQYLEQVTGKRSMNIIIIKEDLSHIYAISDAFKRQEMVCMHADRFLEGNKTLTTPFLGADAKFPAGPFVLAATFRVPVSYVFAFKENSEHYHLFSSKPKKYSNPLKEDMMKDMLQDYVSEIENKARIYPEQWFNYYEFWEQK